ncbi:hypothetical protein Pan97_22840 [Bremerella volcania]|uniref:Uncharacterized protein n=1 Tax=Bremerella volcania TaxID=2527984 RepID=A0A518C7R6_9BACT|nr:hypothetical protein [Bremerella volcania]QDU75254.1 hypothetical protein Pan97_22840 [Bremerella volcania]
MNRFSSNASRRTFLSGAAWTGLGLVHGQFAQGANRSELALPYSDIDWNACRQIGSVTHAHCRSQTSLDMLCRHQLKHLAISNYYPSAPCRPDERVREYQVSQNFATVTGKGYTEKPFHWNEIIRDPQSGWYEKLPADLQEAMPFKIGRPCFSQIPSDVILCPNAEHHSMTDSGGHFNAVGSQFASGTFDVRGRYLLHKHGFAMGTGLPWREAFERMFAELEVADGGGVTINHPHWSRMSAAHAQELLDFDPRVLGIEIWNQTGHDINGRGWSLTQWDSLLSTGRRCWGFAVPDHGHNSNPKFHGRNILLVPQETPVYQLPAACLRAYRNGNFYATLLGRVCLNRIDFSGGRLSVEVTKPSSLRVVTAKGVVHEQTGMECSWTLPAGEGSTRNHVFVRVEADEQDGSDRTFTQPISLV